MLRSLKRSSLTLASRVGFSTWVGRSAWRSQRVLILCYHGVSLEDEHEWNPALYVSAGRLRRRLEVLRRNGCTVLGLGDAVERLRNGELPPRAVVLTFDDGYHDFAARAYPLVCEFDYPVTVYLATKRCEHNFPIVNLLVSYLLWKRRDGELDGRGLGGFGGRYALGSREVRNAVVQRLNEHVRAARLSIFEKDALAAAIAGRLGFDYEALLARRVLRIMTPDQVRALSERGVDFQLHTHCHRTPADVEEFIGEVRENRRRLDAMTGRAAVHFCYPSGVYRPSYLPRLQQEGIVSATTCDVGLATRDTNPLLLPRLVDTSGISEVEFESWVTGAASWLPRRLPRPRRVLKFPTPPVPCSPR